MWLDILVSAALTILTIAMAYLGVHVTLHPAESPRASRWYKIGFLACATSAIALVIWQGVRNGEAQQKAAEASTKLSGTINAISSATQETARVQALNTQLQERLIKESNTISELSRDAIKTATGGDSFCYMSFFDSSLANRPDPSPAMFVVGKYPLYDLSARVVDIDEVVAHPLQPGTGYVASELLHAAESPISIGSMSAGSVWMNDSIHIQFGQRDKRSLH